jgi:hypothetical protein
VNLAWNQELRWALDFWMSVAAIFFVRVFLDFSSANLSISEKSRIVSISPLTDFLYKDANRPFDSRHIELHFKAGLKIGRRGSFGSIFHQCQKTVNHMNKFSVGSGDEECGYESEMNH